jgi:uncharacterized protein YecE (DUF72 family)
VRRFPVVEVQHTFYEPPAEAVLARWRTQAPASFEFTIKAWQVVTHESNSPTYRRLKRPLPDSARGQVGAFRTTPAADALSGSDNSGVLGALTGTASLPASRVIH